jgi:hypothetical protein
MTPESAARLILHGDCTREELEEVARLLLRVATWASVTGDVRLRDRCVQRAADCLAILRRTARRCR